MQYRKVKAVIAATVEVEVEVEVLIAGWPLPVYGEAHVRLMDAAKDKLRYNPPKLENLSFEKAKLEIKSSNMSDWTW